MTIGYLYSSGGGNTRLVGEYIAGIMKQEGVTLEFHNVAVSTPEIFESHTHCILAAPTYDHGVLHEPYYRFLHASKEVNLSSHVCAVIGLGDAKYDEQYNVESAYLLEQFIEKQGGSLVTASLRINKHPLGQLETTIKTRITSYLHSLQNNKG